MARVFTAAEQSDIKRLYNGAKNKRKQIGILAQLHACTKPEVMQVLGLTSEPTRQPQKVSDDARKSAPAGEKQAAKCKYSEVTRQRCVNRILGGQTISEVERDEGIPYKTLYAWARRARAEGACAEDDAVPEVKQDELDELDQGIAGLRRFFSAFAPTGQLSEQDLLQLSRVLDKAAAFAGGVQYERRSRTAQKEKYNAG